MTTQENPPVASPTVGNPSLTVAASGGTALLTVTYPDGSFPALQVVRMPAADLQDLANCALEAFYRLPPP